MKVEKRFLKNYFLVFIIPFLFLLFLLLRRSEKIYVKDEVLSLIKDTELKEAFFQDKDVVLIFWTSTCKPCVRALPKIEEIAEQCSNLNFFAFTPDSVIRKDLIRGNVIKQYSYVRDSSLARLHLFLEYKVRKGYYVASFPFYIVLDKEGYVKEYFVGRSNAFLSYLRRECE